MAPLTQQRRRPLISGRAGRRPSPCRAGRRNLFALTGRWALVRGMADIQGACDDLFTAVPSALAGMLDDGDAGASVAVFVDGEPVVDVWGGFADTHRTIPWQRNTITNVWSVTKTMTALCALVLADRGDLDLAAPVGRYLPQFATTR